MGCTEQENNGEMNATKKKEDVSEATISKLLSDFNSAALLKGTLDSHSESTVAAESLGYEEIASSLKKLHLRKPVNSRQKFKDRKGYAKKGKASTSNKYNLSVAAVNVQRPVVWPGKLSSSSRKDVPSLLQPSRLSLSKKEEEKKDGPSFPSVVNTSSIEERSRIESELTKRNIQQFGTLSDSSEHFPSFSNLSRRHSKTETETQAESSSCKSISSSVKRPNSCTIPVAKHPRLYNEIHVGSDIAHCLDYRCSRSYEDNTNGNCFPSPKRRTDGAVGENLPSETDVLCACHQVSSSAVNVTSTVSNSDHIFSCDEVRMDESNVNELASYFDDLLHIPKKMSVMAEMMYA